MKARSAPDIPRSYDKCLLINIEWNPNLAVGGFLPARQVDHPGQWEQAPALGRESYLDLSREIWGWTRLAEARSVCPPLQGLPDWADRQNSLPDMLWISRWMR